MDYRPLAFFCEDDRYSLTWSGLERPGAPGRPVTQGMTHLVDLERPGAPGRPVTQGMTHLVDLERTALSGAHIRTSYEHQKGLIFTECADFVWPVTEGS